MLTPPLFNDLSKKDQADLLQNEGLYLNTRNEAEFVVDVYELEGFFIEVYYHQQQEDVIAVKSYYPTEQSYKEAV